MTDDDTPDTYHTCNRGERDHLLAAAQLQGDAPSGMDIQRQVEALRVDERPSNNTTYNALDRLVAYGWLSREHVDDKATAFRLTDRGRDIIEHARREFDV